MTCPGSDSIRRQVLFGRPVEISRSRQSAAPPAEISRSATQSPVPELCQNPIVLAHRGLLSEREQLPQVVDNRHFRIEQMECLEPLTVIRNQQVAGSSPAGGSIFSLSYLWFSICDLFESMGPLRRSTRTPELPQQPRRRCFRPFPSPGGRDRIAGAFSANSGPIDLASSLPQ
jgi:hypothetical protein